MNTCAKKIVPLSNSFLINVNKSYFEQYAKIRGNYTRNSIETFFRFGIEIAERYNRIKTDLILFVTLLRNSNGV